jgi:hypothetical protein
VNGRYGKSKLKLPFLSTINCTAKMETVTNMKAKYNEMWRISIFYYIPPSHLLLMAQVSAYNSLYFVLLFIQQPPVSTYFPNFLPSYPPLVFYYALYPTQPAIQQQHGLFQGVK